MGQAHTSPLMNQTAFTLEEDDDVLGTQFDLPLPTVDLVPDEELDIVDENYNFKEILFFQSKCRLVVRHRSLSAHV